MNKQLLAHLLLFVAQFLYGANYTIAKEAMPEFIQPFGFVLMRCLGGTALFWLVGLFVKEKLHFCIDLHPKRIMFLCAVYDFAAFFGLRRCAHGFVL